MKQKQRGFTLIEVMLVLVIAASVMWLTMRLYESFRIYTLSKQLQLNIEQIAQGMQKFYYADCYGTTKFERTGPNTVKQSYKPPAFLDTSYGTGIYQPFGGVLLMDSYDLVKMGMMSALQPNPLLDASSTYSTQRTSYVYDDYYDIWIIQKGKYGMVGGSCRPFCGSLIFTLSDAQVKDIVDNNQAKEMSSGSVQSAYNNGAVRPNVIGYSVGAAIQIHVTIKSAYVDSIDAIASISGGTRIAPTSNIIEYTQQLHRPERQSLWTSTPTISQFNNMYSTMPINNLLDRQWNQPVSDKLVGGGQGPQVNGEIPGYQYFNCTQ